MSRKLVTGTLVAALAVISLACTEGSTEPLPDLDLVAGRAGLGAGSDSAAATGDTASAGALPAEQVVTLFASSASGIEDERRQVVEDDGAWSVAWAELHAHMTPPPPTPLVDFVASRVILVTSGARSNGGHRLELVDVTSGDAGLTVAVNDVVPGPNCLVTQQITHPALAISVPRTGDAVTVSVVRVYDDCG